MSPRNSPLATKLIRSVMSIYFLVAFGVTVVQLIFEYLDEQDRLNTQVDHIAEIFLPVLGQALWNYEELQIETTTDGILKNDFIFGVVVTDETQRRVSSKESIANITNNPSDSKNTAAKQSKQPQNIKSTNTRIEYRYPIYFSDPPQVANRQLGELILYSDSTLIVERAAKTFIFTIINAVIKTIALWIIFYYMLKAYLIKPMATLQEAIERLNPSSTATKAKDIDIDEKTISQSNELGLLIRSFIETQNALLERNKEVKDYHDSLEDKVEERTKQLSDLSKRLAKTNEFKSQFLANMSHEIRTPMNGVVGLLELLKESKLNAQQAYYIETIQASTDTLIQIINDVLDYSKIEAGAIELENIPVNLYALLDHIGAIFSARAREKHLKLIIDIDPKTPHFINSDPTRLQQVITNLTSNAIKFTDVGEIIIKAEPDEQQEHIRFSVCDTGIGMTESQTKNLFEAFVQADASTTRRYGGTGLGLAICKRLVNKMQGDIEIKSEPGKGSEFYFSVRAPSLSETNQIVSPASITIKQVLFSTEDTESTNSWAHTLEILGIDSERIFKPSDIQQFIANNSNISLNEIAVVLENSHMQFEDFTQLQIQNPCHCLIAVNQENRHPHTLDIEARIIETDAPFTPISFERSITLLKETAESENSLRNQQTFDSSGIKVLVAEDNKVNQMVIVGLLKSFGIETSIAKDGAEAVELYERSPEIYRAIFMDCQMPVMDGYQATAQIRALEQEHSRERKLIVAFSAHALTEEKTRSLEAGMDDHLSKPVKKSDLRKLLSEYKIIK